MVIKGRLRLALAAERGVDLIKLRQLKKHKEALKRKCAHLSVATLQGLDSDHGKKDGEDKHGVSECIEVEEKETLKGNLETIDESETSMSSVELEVRIPRGSKVHHILNGDKVNKDEMDEGVEEDIPVSDLEDIADEEREDLVPHTRLTINNTSALIAALNRISIPTDQSAPFVAHQSVVASATTAESIPDVSDDLQRELSFYSQCLEAARQGRARIIAEGTPFSRPKDYFAEMVKEDAHMEKVKAKLVEEASAKKAAAESRKLRDLKKFGKQVQIAKLQERQKTKRETLEKIKFLKRKRQESNGDLSTKETDVFDVGVENEIAKPFQRSDPGRRPSRSHSINPKRQKKDQKYGFGGKKRHAKSGDAVSSGDLTGFNAKKMKAGAMTKAPRPGKNRRKAMFST